MEIVVLILICYDRWKEECAGITAKFEAKVQDLREECKREKQRTSEMTKLLRESRDKTVDVSIMMSRQE